VEGQVHLSWTSDSQNSVTNVLRLDLAEGGSTMESVGASVGAATALVPVETKVPVHIFWWNERDVNTFGTLFRRSPKFTCSHAAAATDSVVIWSTIFAPQTIL
jgi:hypothetical protein